MPDVPSYTAPTSGVLSSDPLAQELFQREVTPGNQAVMNGHLTDANRKTGWTIQRHMIQPGAFTKGGMSAGNDNRDFFYDPYFSGADLTRRYPSANTPGYEDLMRVVIGRTWYNDIAPKAVWVFWHAVAVMDSSVGVDYDGSPVDGSPDETSTLSDFKEGFRLALFINGNRIAVTDHRQKEGLHSMVESSNPADPHKNFKPSYPDIRVYNGAICIDTSLADAEGLVPADVGIAPGWQDADLRVVCRGGKFVVNGNWVWRPDLNRPWGQVRIKSRRIAVLPLY